MSNLKPPEEIINLDFLNDIKTGIRKYGVYLMFVSDRDNDNDPLTGGYVYSIGHQERNRPDFLINIYTEDNPSEELVLKRMKSAGALINSVVLHWDESPMLAGHTAADDTGVIFQVRNNEGLDKDYRELTFQLTNYYGRTDYPLLVLTPTGLTH